MPPALSLINSIPSPRGGQEASFSITWEHIKNAQALPQTCWIRNSGQAGGRGGWRWEGRLCGSAGKESAHNAGDMDLIPGLGRYPGEGKGYPLQYSGLENSMDCIVREVAESDTTERLSLTPLTPVILTHPNIWEPQFSALNSPSLPTEHPFSTFPEKNKTKANENKNPEVNEPPMSGIATFPCTTLSIHTHIVRTEMILSFSTSNPQ